MTLITYRTHHRILGRIWMWIYRRRGYITTLSNVYGHYTGTSSWLEYRTRYIFTAEEREE